MVLTSVICKKNATRNSRLSYHEQVLLLVLPRVVGVKETSFSKPMMNFSDVIDTSNGNIDHHDTIK